MSPSKSTQLYHHCCTVGVPLVKRVHQLQIWRHHMNCSAYKQTRHPNISLTFLCIYISLSLTLYVCVCVCLCLCKREREREREREKFVIIVDYLSAYIFVYAYAYICIWLWVYISIAFCWAKGFDKYISLYIYRFNICFLIARGGVSSWCYG